MRTRSVVATLALLVAGAGGGALAGGALRAGASTVSAAAPLPARAPSFPVDPVRPYAADIDYPSLLPGRRYQRHTLGDPPFAWAYRAPRGWVATEEGLDEIRWRPDGEPLVGGYSLRVKLSTEHKSKAAMVAQKLAAMRAGYQDVEIVRHTADTLAVSYRDPTLGTRRLNAFRWFSAPGGTEAAFEMSVVGRTADRAGLDDLLEQVGGGVVKAS